MLALGRLGWSLRRIEESTGVRRETASAYLKAAGIAVRGKGGRAGTWPPKPATTEGVSTDPGSNPAISRRVSTDSGSSKPATTEGVSPDSGASAARGRAGGASACEPFRELIAEALSRGRNAKAIWQDLVDEHGFTGRYASVKRFAAKLRGERGARGAGRHHHAAGRGSAGRLRRGADGARPGERASTAGRGSSCLTLGLLAQVGPPAHLEIEHADLGRASRAGLAPARRHAAGHRARQPARRRAHARHLRSRAQPALPRHARALRCGRAAVPCEESRSQGQGRVGCRPRSEHAFQGTAASKTSKRHRPTSTAGKSAGRTRVSTGRPSARWP